jgi:phage host-nuclease inhibitor protein Gam
MEISFQMKHAELALEAVKEVDQFASQVGNTIRMFQGSIVLNLNDQTAQVSDGWQPQLNQVKQAYSQKAISLVAKKNRWAKVTDKTNQNQGIFRRF